MFCPKCSTKNLEGAHFCRTCGANISLVPQALSGQLVQPPAEQVDEVSCSGRGRRRELTLDNAFKNIFKGVAFLVIAIALSRTIGRGWWFWFLLPAFSLFATGLAQYIRLREREKRASLAPPMVGRSFVEPPRRPEELRNPVASVTEGTTRHLGVELPTRHLDSEPK